MRKGAAGNLSHGWAVGSEPLKEKELRDEQLLWDPGYNNIMFKGSVTSKCEGDILCMYIHVHIHEYIYIYI